MPRALGRVGRSSAFGLAAAPALLHCDLLVATTGGARATTKGAVALTLAVRTPDIGGAAEVVTALLAHFIAGHDGPLSLGNVATPIVPDKLPLVKLKRIYT